MGRPWFCYLVECADGTLYAGITTDLARRVAEHNRGTAAKYTRGRGSVHLVYAETQPDRASASRRERVIKALPTGRKRQLCEGWSPAATGGLRASHVPCGGAAAARTVLGHAVAEPCDPGCLERRLLADLAGFCERFLQVVANHGPAAGESLLGGYVEWLGVDLVDALVSLPAERGRALDALAERFLVAARQILRAGTGEHAASVVALAGECRRRAQGDGAYDSGA